MTADTESALADLRLVRSYLSATRTQVLMDDDRRAALDAIGAVKAHIEHLEANRDELRKALDGMIAAPFEPVGYSRPDGPASRTVDACNDAISAARRAIEKAVEG